MQLLVYCSAMRRNPTRTVKIYDIEIHSVIYKSNLSLPLYKTRHRFQNDEAVFLFLSSVFTKLSTVFVWLLIYFAPKIWRKQWRLSAVNFRNVGRQPTTPRLSTLRFVHSILWNHQPATTMHSKNANETNQTDRGMTVKKNRWKVWRWYWNRKSY